VFAGTSIVLDASASSDPEGEALTFAWSEIAAPNGDVISIANANASRAQVTLTDAGLYQFSVTVTDTAFNSAVASVNIEVDALPPPPPPPPTGTMQIAEVFVNPAGIDAGLEWVKVKNTSGVDVDLSKFAIAFGGNTTWGNTAGGNGGVLPMTGSLAAGACMLVVAGSSTPVNANPELSTAIVEPFPGNGLQNPSTPADAIGLFDVSSGPVSSTSRPIDVLVYGATAAPSPSGFVGVDGNPAPVDIRVSDAAQGKSFRRTATGVVESGAIGAADGSGPSPNSCP
jgi:hypothetical protein